MITSYNSLPVGKYFDILAVPTDLPEIVYQVKVISILSDISEDELLDMPLAEYQKLAGGTEFLEAPIFRKDGRTPYDGRSVPDRFTVGPFRLVLEKDVRKMTVAQYVDFQEFSKNPDQLPELLSCVLIPEGCKYNEVYDITQVQGAIRRCMPITDAAAVSAFFLRTYAVSLRRILIFSAWDIQKKPSWRRTKAEKEILRQSKSLIRSLRGGAGLQTLMRYLSSPARPGIPSGK